MCSISVAPMPSMISMPVASFHSLRVAAGSASPADTHLRRLDRSNARDLRGHRAIRRRRGEQHASADARAIAGSNASGDGLLEQQRRRADAQRKQQQAAEPERERERRAADEEVVGAMRAASSAASNRSRQHVAMEVHRALRLAGRARRERDQRGVVGGGVDVGERRRLSARTRVDAHRRRVVAEHAATVRQRRAREPRRVQLVREAARRTARARSAPCR